MSVDYALWRWRTPARISRGLCYVLVASGAEVPEVESLDVERYRALLSTAFPAWAADDGTATFTCDLQPTAILLQTYRDTQEAVFRWFLDLAEQEGLEFFDPQAEPITNADKHELERRSAAVAEGEEARRLRRELPGLLTLADANDPRALVELGNRYSFGDGVAHDLSRAFLLYLRAAELGLSDGMFNVAACYRLGEGVAKDLAAAATWYERALENDKIFAPFALGELYSRPDGLPNDTAKAIAYFQIALENGHQDARRELRRLGALPPLDPATPVTERIGHIAYSLPQLELVEIRCSRSLSLPSSAGPRNTDHTPSLPAHDHTALLTRSPRSSPTVIAVVLRWSWQSPFLSLELVTVSQVRRACHCAREAGLLVPSRCSGPHTAVRPGASA